MTVIEVLLRGVSALHGLDPAALGSLPGLTIAALGLGALGITVAAVGAVAAALLVLRLVALLTGADAADAGRASRTAPDLVTRIAWSDPDADGHPRPRAPGAVPAV
ncbi:DUF6412 domain-containing protein [Curtobacterium herbarum]|uniref:Uncharacterized protein n=1 Tax=Curtobacterium herbarum TaxID=150122 RepID=A0ABP4K3L7_9MICO|nr:DUF6412 domain-containing protein [Curtobacterium herbarum]MBM7475456.1 hypothetical protein [Curtobacterium herbarum]MCS6543372.1 DUF6412 domain-containing protein [Curtobacterium herbarum]